MSNLLSKAKMVSLSDLMMETFISPLKISHNSKQKLLQNFLRKGEAVTKLNAMAEKLNFMRQRFTYYRWTPLILLKFPEPDSITKTTIYNCLREICKNIQYEYDGNKSLRFGVKSTYAGRTFVEIAPDFEFFAVRFQKVSKPLFYYNPSSDANEVLMHIEAIRSKAFNCIEDMIKKTNAYLTDDNGGRICYNRLYSSNNSYKIQRLYRKFDFASKCHIGSERTHASRIIISHIGYLNNYRRYVIYELLNNTATIFPNRFATEFHLEVNEDFDIYVQSYLNVVKLEDFEKYVQSYLDVKSENFEKYVQSHLEAQRLSLDSNDMILRIPKAVKLSLFLLDVIGVYINKLEELTKINGGNKDRPEYYEGGSKRVSGERNDADDWSIGDYGYNTLKDRWLKARRYPINTELSILPDNDNEAENEA